MEEKEKGKVIVLRVGYENLLYVPRDEDEEEITLQKALIERADEMYETICKSTRLHYAEEEKNPKAHAYRSNETLLVNPIISYPPNVIAFCGDRGQGKSSALAAYSKHLEDNRERTCVLGRIDPHHIEDYDDIVTLVLSMMLREIEINCPSDDWQKSEYQQFYGLIRQCTALVHSRKEKKYHPVYNYDEDELSSLILRSQTINLRGIFAEVVTQFLGVMYGVRGKSVKEAMLVIPIDDIDLDIRHAQSMVEDMRRYLTVPNVVVLTAVNPVQLAWCIGEHYSKSARNALERELINSAEIHRMASKYVDKHIPERRRLYLLDIADSTLGIKLAYVDDEKNDLITEKKYNIKDARLWKCAVTEFVWKKIGMKFRETEIDRELKSLPLYIIEDNMRRLVDFMCMMQSMKDYAPMKINCDEDLLKSRMRNLSLFENYIVEIYAPRISLRGKGAEITQWQTNEYADIIRSISHAEHNRKHEVTCKSIIAHLIGSKKVDEAEGKPNNKYTILDVCSMLKKLRKIYMTGEHFLALAIEAIYDITLRRLRLEDKADKAKSENGFVGLLLEGIIISTIDITDNANGKLEAPLDNEKIVVSTVESKELESGNWLMRFLKQKDSIPEYVYDKLTYTGFISDVQDIYDELNSIIAGELDKIKNEIDDQKQKLYAAKTNIIYFEKALSDALKTNKDAEKKNELETNLSDSQKERDDIIKNNEKTKERANAQTNDAVKSTVDKIQYIIYNNIIGGYNWKKNETEQLEMLRQNRISEFTKL
jgi:hypothetical protein